MVEFFDTLFEKKKKISVVSSCFNEEENIDEIYNSIKIKLEKFKDKYDYEIILVDNASTDKTAEKLKNIAFKNSKVKVVLNSRNFGHIRSPYYAIINAKGDAVIYLASDLQDPPELIEQFIQKWENGYKIVLAQKQNSKETFLLKFLRKLFYFILRHIADDQTEQIKDCTGFGLFDKKIIELAKLTEDPYPYFRGFLCEVGFEKAYIPFIKQERKRGITKNNFYTLYDNAMIGIVKHSKVPLRLMAFCGFILSAFSMFIAFVYFIYKILNWNTFDAGMAPIVIGLFFFSSVQLFFIGILGEYIGAIYTRIDKKPLIVEKEKINFS